MGYQRRTTHKEINMARKKTNKPERSTLDIAQELSEVREEKNLLVGTEKLLSEQLKERIKRGDPQNLFKLVKIPTLKITNNAEAVAWAAAAHPQLITVNTTDAKEVFRRSLLPLPEGFEMKEIEQLRSVKNGDADHD